MGYSDLGCYGSEIKTPNLDKLAANGIHTPLHTTLQNVILPELVYSVECIISDWIVS